MDPGKIEILGNQIVVIGDLLVLEASILADKIKHGELDNSFEAEASKLDINGSKLSLLGDFFIAIAATLEAQEVEGPLSQSSRDNILGDYLVVIGEFLGVKAFYENIEEEKVSAEQNKN
ncbi:MAG TPA: hypothetical protein VIK72_19115 [Clostridiaceae bacterium]